MKAAIFEAFGQPPVIKELPDPKPPVHGAVIRVKATGICRSDWHAWKGHDPDVRLPHVPGHEFSGTVEKVGAHIRFWKPGDRVTLPFVCGCGRQSWLPMDRVVADELEILGSHGIQAHAYPAVLAIIAAGKLQPEKLLGKTVSLAEGIEALQNMDGFESAGITVIDRFD